ncbi:MAG: threonylcarbamoyl-AMP synthase [Candidatus Eremiobacteraeota bacterium]|nr:threonylcarbamoyl-AMP synthase [Candidatus Eremiobacteraeota bacterium]
MSGWAGEKRPDTIRQDIEKIETGAEVSIPADHSGDLSHVSGTNKINTRILFVDNPVKDKDKIEEAARVLRDGGLVAFPTETVYGLGVNALLPSAVRRLFEVKGRPGGMPVALHLHSPHDVEKWVKHLPETAIRLMAQFLPGPLMLVLERSDEVPDLITGGTRKIGIRVVRHPVGAALLEKAGVPVAATSANLSGSLSPITVQHVWEELGDRIELILESSESPMGIESTVIDLTANQARILRPGFITREEIGRIIGIEPRLSSDLWKDTRRVARPCKYETWVLKADQKDMLSLLLRVAEENKDKNLMFLVTGQHAAHLEKYGSVEILSLEQPAEKSTEHLFSILRDMDKKDFDLLIIEGIKPSGYGEAIMDRINRISNRTVTPTDIPSPKKEEQRPVMDEESMLLEDENEF